MVYRSSAIMGRNKEIRKKIEGHRKMILDHRAKLEKEMKSTSPDSGVIALWQKRIKIVEDQILRLENKLRRH